MTFLFLLKQGLTVSSQRFLYYQYVTSRYLYLYRWIETPSRILVWWLGQCTKALSVLLVIHFWCFPFFFFFFMIITVREFLLFFKLRLSIWSNVMRNFLNLEFLVLVNPKGNRQHFDVTDQTRLELAVLVELGDS